MSRVLHVITTIARGGVENHLVGLVARQRAAGHAVAVAYLREQPYWREALERHGAVVHPLAIKRYGDPAGIARLRASG
jgi:hypothetical protein